MQCIGLVRYNNDKKQLTVNTAHTYIHVELTGDGNIAVEANNGSRSRHATVSYFRFHLKWRPYRRQRRFCFRSIAEPGRTQSGRFYVGRTKFNRHSLLCMMPDAINSVYSWTTCKPIWRRSDRITVDISWLFWQNTSPSDQQDHDRQTAFCTGWLQSRKASSKLPEDASRTLIADADLMTSMISTPPHF